MERYTNIGGDSSVRAFECATDSIIVEFSDGSAYLYTHASCGQNHCEQMKRLARAGDGLNSYIMRNVRRGYARKLR